MQMFPTASPVGRRRLLPVIGLVAGGGAIGASVRSMVGRLFDLEPAVWPWPTLLVNIAGCAVIGMVAGRIERGSISWDFVVTGVLGGFTTMSSFAVELNEMVDNGRSGMAAFYCLATLAGGAVALTAFARTGRTTR